jgi:hypothetical protein
MKSDGKPNQPIENKMRSAVSLASEMRKGRPVIFRTGLREEREKRGLTCIAVAACVGMKSSDSVAEAEEGYGVNLLTAIRLARFYERTVDDLWHVIDDPPSGVGLLPRTPNGKQKKRSK